jgi:regulator of sirC expression with transglutaminase-like and TPR domain
MGASVQMASSQVLPENQRSALVSLLGDEDPAVYRVVRGKLLSYGTVACEWLRPHLLSSDPIIRRRAMEIVNKLGRQNGDECFLDFCLHHGEEFELEAAVGLLAQTQYPDTNWPAYRALLDHWAAEIQEELPRRADAEAVLHTVGEYLFGDLGFTGNARHGDNPENCYLNRVIDHRTGNPISLCSIYLFLARRLNLPVTGIGLPGHFLCRYQSSTKEIYIDAFHLGRFWTKADCIRFLINSGYSLQEGYLAPVSPRRMLLRMCANLHQTYSMLEMTDEAVRMQRYLVALAK